jgi:hypothetical protein
LIINNVIKIQEKGGALLEEIHVFQEDEPMSQG